MQPSVDALEKEKVHLGHDDFSLIKAETEQVSTSAELRGLQHCTVPYLTTQLGKPIAYQFAYFFIMLMLISKQLRTDQTVQILARF